MNQSHAIPSLLISIGLCAALAGSQAHAGSETRNLLDESLRAWEVFTGVPHKTVTAAGIPASTSTDGTSGDPIGLGDPLGIFKVIMEDGAPVLHVSGQVYAGLTTREEFGNYHFSCRFKWGGRKWEPRLDLKRDSGILYHCSGKHGAFWNVWMNSLECQIQEGDCGDFISLAGARASLRAALVPPGPNPPYDPQGVFYSDIGYAAHGPSHEKPNDEWNLVEIYTLGDVSVHVVNGTPNMVLFDTRIASHDGPTTVPLTRGKIQIQSEAAEIFYRDITIRPITEFPEFLRRITTRPSSPAVPYKRKGEG